jgi:flagellar biosynthesis chaperone FliJ
MTDDAPTQLAALVAQRDKAQRRIEQLEAERREAVQAREAARRRLVEFEQAGGRSADRAKLERALSDAEAKASERWPERLEGARAALREAGYAVSRFTHARLDELVEAKQRDGEIAVERLSECARAIVEAHAQRERVAQELSALVTSAGIMIRPGDVSRSRAEQLARAASELVMAGGEEPPRLTRDPRVPRAGAPMPESLTA